MRFFLLFVIAGRPSCEVVLLRRPFRCSFLQLQGFCVAAVWAALHARLPEPPALRTVRGIGIGIGTIAVGYEVSDARSDEEEVLPQLISDGHHKAPAWASDVHFSVPLPMMTWSWMRRSSSFAQSTSCFVRRRSSRLGVGSPLG